MRFELYQDKLGEYRWRLRGGNGEPIADSAEGYSSKSNCQHGIDLIKTYAANAQVIDLTVSPQRR